MAISAIDPVRSRVAGESHVAGRTQALHSRLAAESGKGTGRPAPAGSGTGDLTPEQQAQVKELAQVDHVVHVHEQAHAAAAGKYVRSGPTYQYQTGPDGKRYAVAGEVQLDTTPIADDPAATVAKMQQIRRAALAPADPSPQDQSVAAQAGKVMAQARADEGGLPAAEGAGKPAADDQPAPEIGIPAGKPPPDDTDKTVSKGKTAAGRTKAGATGAGTRAAQTGDRNVKRSAISQASKVAEDPQPLDLNRPPDTAQPSRRPDRIEIYRVAPTLSGSSPKVSFSV